MSPGRQRTECGGKPSSWFLHLPTLRGSLGSTQNRGSSGPITALGTGFVLASTQGFCVSPPQASPDVAVSVVNSELCPPGNRPL